MSWLLGAVDAPKKVCDDVRGLVRRAPSSFLAEPFEGFVLAAGGLPETCHFSQREDTGWIAVGLGLIGISGDIRLADTSHWAAILAEAPAALRCHDGHLAAVLWQAESIELFTDVLGLRTLYYIAAPNKGVVFSTRLDWLCQLTRRSDIDFEAFGAQWLAFNQIDTKSPIKGIRRLGPGGRLGYRQGQIEVSETPWTPSWEAATPESFGNRLAGFVNPSLPTDRRISLGLSGGMDSRLLLALRSSQQPATVHTFGSPRHPDGRIAGEIAQKLSLDHAVYDQPLPDAAEAISLLKSHISQTQPIVPASAVLGLRYYTSLYRNGRVVIDGGWGELARRQFLNRLRIRGSGAIENGDPESISSFLYTPRPALFTAEVNAMMRAGLVKQVAEALDRLPLVAEVGTENWLDLFSVRTRLPNFFGFEQNRLDGTGINYMPFAQPSLLDLVFGLPVAERRNGRLFRKLIRRYRPVLTRFPLVKGDRTYPYRLPPPAVHLWTRTQSLLQPARADDSTPHFLQIVREFALDTLHSNSISDFAGYDTRRLKDAVEGYYSGGRALSGFVDWWLSFEVWRQQLGGR